MTLMRLQRALARAGVTSRRKAEDLIRAGRVRVDGVVASLGVTVDTDRPRLAVDGRGRGAGRGRGIEVELTLAEGRQRIVRRLAEQLDLKVEWLHRVAYGPVRLGSLREGAHRALTAREIRGIERLHGPA